MMRSWARQNITAGRDIIEHYIDDTYLLGNMVWKAFQTIYRSYSKLLYLCSEIMSLNSNNSGVSIVMTRNTNCVGIKLI